jgi:hypothetical protein
MGQTKGSARLYGYKQYVSGGKGPEVKEGSTTKVSGGAGKNYFLYTVSSSRIYPSEIWIEGVRYGVNSKSITKTPVEISESGNIGAPAKQLVPATKDKVVQLIPNPGSTAKSSGTKAGSLAKTNELVVVYKLNGKFYYNTLETLSDLDSAAMN